MKRWLNICVAVTSLLAATGVLASFHTFRIEQLYSNADGTVQFVVMHESENANGENLWAGQALTSTHSGVTKVYVFPNNLPGGESNGYYMMPSPTANKRVLIATQGYAALNLVVPDYVISNGFLPTDGGTVNYANIDPVTYTSLPTDGVMALDRNGAIVQNLATNFAGASASVPPPAPPPPVVPPVVQPTMPGIATVVSNPYGPLGVQGGTLNGNTISDLQGNAVIQLGGTAGSAGSSAEFDFQGFNVGAGKTLTIRSGAPGQTVQLKNVDATASSISGLLQAQGGNGGPAPGLALKNPNGISVNAGGSVSAVAGLLLDTFGATWTAGQILLNNGLIDGGSALQLNSGRVTGSGAFKGDIVGVATYGNVNNPVNGAHFLGNGLQLYPSSGDTVELILNAYGSSPQVLNFLVNGNASVWMPSAWPAGWSAPANNLPVPPSGSRPPGTPDPGFGGGSMIVQATGTLNLANGGTSDFVFPGGIVLKAGGDLNLNGVVVNNGWTASGKSFQGVFFESPNIVSDAGNIQVLTNNFNWVNFSTRPHASVRTWQLVPAGDGSLTYVTADTIAPHLNTFSVLVDAGATGACWLCLVNTTPINMQ